ncbi:hypothetical protein Leryth_022456 [Lithospermum erythrorhizon]|nr:hypothetical protein Leryth_022456 [Lithospermum erythrorhizon]
MEKNEKENMVEMNENGRVTKDEEPEHKYRGIKAMPFIIGNETFEKLGGIGILSNLLVYLTTFFNLKRFTATTIINVFNGTTNFATMIGAFFSDTYFGRYKTIGFGSISSFLGLLVITLTAAIKKLHPPHCHSDDKDKCIGPTSWQIAFLLTGFGFMMVGAAGIRPCSLAFGADQFNPKTESGKSAINSFFNWYFFTMTFAQMIAVTLVVYIQSDISWPIGLAIPTLFMFVATILFFVGTRIYVIVKPEGSPMTSVVQVIVAAVKKRKLVVPEEPWLSLYNYTPEKSINSKLQYTEQFRCLNKAAIKSPEDELNPDGSPADRWTLCTLQQVEETKCVVRVLPIWAAAIVFHLAIIHQQQYAVFQALQSDRHLGNSKFQIPAASYTIFSMLSLSLFVPVYDRLIVPRLRKLTGKEEGITLLQRIGIGVCLGVVSSLVSGFVEERRRTLALTKPLIHSKKGAVSPMSALFLVPQISIVGLADAFAAIGQVEFYYKQLPENMRSFAGALLFCNGAASSYVNSLLIAVVHKTTEGAATGNWLPEDLNKGRLDYFYFLVAALGSLNVCYFLVISKWYRYKGTEVESYNGQTEMKNLDKHVA